MLSELEVEDRNDARTKNAKGGKQLKACLDGRIKFEESAKIHSPARPMVKPHIQEALHRPYGDQ